MRKLLLAFVMVLVCAPAFADPACQDQCNLDYWTCSDNCGAFGGALCEQNCVNAHNSCTSWCSQCPKTRDYSTTTILSSTHTGSKQCIRESDFANNGYKFWQYFVQYRVTNYREVTNCDYSKTTTVLSTQDGSTYCWEKSPFQNDTCSPYLSRTGFSFCS